jgi:hypothetical protein
MSGTTPRAWEQKERSSIKNKKKAVTLAGITAIFRFFDIFYFTFKTLPSTTLSLVRPFSFLS